jgi:hypothetical protein
MAVSKPENRLTAIKRSSLVLIEGIKKDLGSAFYFYLSYYKFAGGI